MKLITNLIALGIQAVASSLGHPPLHDLQISPAIHKIKHVVVIMQENRSFDTYFGTYPGVDGIPRKNGQITVCVPDPEHGDCIKPYLNEVDSNQGGPHGYVAALTDINGGAMNGFVASAEHEHEQRCRNTSLEPNCVTGEGAYREVMGYHDGSQIPNYWAYAKNFVLQERMFEPNKSWSLPAHLFEVSAWSARCPVFGNPMDCVNAVQSPEPVPEFSPTGAEPNYDWTDVTYLLRKHHVSWKYFVFTGGEPECDINEDIPCSAGGNLQPTPEIWSPLPYFVDVREDGQLPDIESINTFYADARAGTLPSVSWLAPDDRVSEHPPAGISTGQAYVTTAINAVMRSPDWSSTAIFVSWDDWGGFYDNAVPPTVDQSGYGLRVPGLVISPYARHGYIDRQILSHDAYLKFIENDFLEGERLNPATDGRPDSRPDVREELPILGNLESDFNFNQPPTPPFLLPPDPQPWSIPTAFRLLTSGLRTRQAPAAQGGNLIARLTCTLRCQVSISGKVRLQGIASLAGVQIVPRTISFSGTRAVAVHMRGLATDALRARIAASHGAAQALLQVSAQQVGAPSERTQAQLPIQLLP
ncbi:MAG TPA: alkaline phosphatase family protein [Solirubrobacteraceae bacterium]|nr:alkaline phosphatase family protein [Solirubrobacteraceae bacterium]